MKVILIQDVKTLGKKDAIIEVNDGYARNFLFAKGFAIEANSTNINMLSNKKQSEDRKKGKELEVANKLAEKINSIEILLKTKSGDNGKLFGFITSKDVCEKLKAVHKIDIDKRKIEMSEAIKTIGNYSVDVRVYNGINAKLKVKVEAE